jgi:ABC-type antimicrobial peptide transport system permease subunit
LPLTRPILSTKGFDQLFGVIAIVGWIIGGFSLLVGGFGIANIMFVSVKERTRIIGIQKSLGAKNFFILLQFLFEAVFLSLMGGVVGLVFVFMLTFTVSQVFDMSLYAYTGKYLSRDLCFRLYRICLWACPGLECFAPGPRGSNAVYLLNYSFFGKFFACRVYFNKYRINKHINAIFIN